MKPYKVYFIGAGIGSPDLITVRGLRILKAADVVIYDYLTEPELLAEVHPGAERISCGDLGKHHAGGTGSMRTAQQNINTLMIDRALHGKKVVRLKNGDHALFSRISSELAALREHTISFEIVPGVSAASAVSAYTGIPLTDRSCASDVVMITGHEASDAPRINWHSIAGCATVVVYMGVAQIASIAQKLIAAGKPPSTPVCAVADAASIRQTSVTATLDTIADQVTKKSLTPPALFIIGEVVNFKDSFDWLHCSRKILYTGLSDERYFLDGLFFHVPMIEIVPLDDYTEFDAYMRKISTYDWLIFTSRYGVQYFFERLQAAGLDTRALAGARIAAIGASTATSLRRHGIRADVVPHRESSAGLIESMQQFDLTGKKVFIPRSDLSDKGITEALGKQGAEVDAAVAYRNIMPNNLPDIDFDFFDGIFFTSPSTVRHFLRRYKQVPPHLEITCIGDVTRNEALKWNIIAPAPGD